MKWIKMTEFEKKTQAKRAAKELHQHGFATQIKKHQTRTFNRQPSNYTLMRSLSKRKK